MKNHTESNTIVVLDNKRVIAMQQEEIISMK